MNTDALSLPAHLRAPADVVAATGTDLDRGLASSEVEARLAADGPNELRSVPPEPKWRRFLRQFHDPLIYLLLLAMAISLVAWLLEGAAGLPIDVIVISAIVVLNSIMGYVQEQRASDAVAALQNMTEVTATVIRDGEQSRIPARGLVRGDVLLLAEGDSVGADARIVTASALKVQEASLTGESESVTKRTEALSGEVALGDRMNMVYKGTAVAQGTGRAVVTGTGMDTEMGRIAELMATTQEDPTPLQREVNALGKTLGVAVILIAIVVVVVTILVSDLRTPSDYVVVLLLGVSLAVAAVPEGLPAILSVVLSMGVRRMADRNAIVKNLSSVETLGSASVIASDKTGTLTRSEMAIARIITASGEAEVTGIGYAPEGEVLVAGQPIADTPQRSEVQVLLSSGTRANDAVLEQTQDGEWVIQGDPTEAAFLVAAHKLEGTLAIAGKYERRAEVPFTSERKMMSVLDASPEKIRGFSKGAPDVLLEHCEFIRVGDDVVPLTAERRAALLQHVEKLSAQAYRTLGVAYRRYADPEEALAARDSETLETGLIYLGVVGIIDPPRPEAAAAITEAHRAGVRVMMITGDHPVTAARIGSDLGIVPAGTRAVTGLELDALDDDGWRDVVRKHSVYARVAPEHKLRIVDALQADGSIVAMTGDGVNDAPALKSADIGIAMGITGTEVTKEASKLVLADDNFATIVTAVREGRHIFDNIRKFLRYLLSSNMGEVFTVFFGVVLAGVIGLTAGGEAIAVPLLAVQILWINLVTDSFPALAMGVDPEVDDVMARNPRKLTDRVIDRTMWAVVLWLGFVMAAGVLITMDWAMVGGLIPGTHTIENGRTIGFTTLVLMQLFNAFNARSPVHSAFSDLFTNKWLLLSVAFGVVTQVFVVEVPVLQAAFGTTHMDLTEWLVAIAMASTVLWVEELRKFIVRVQQPHLA